MWPAQVSLKYCRLSIEKIKNIYWNDTLQLRTYVYLSYPRTVAKYA